MNCEPVSPQLKGVVCIFCSRRTPLPVSSLNQAPANGFADRTARISLIRCQHCSKEAQYRAIEVIPLQVASYAASA